jgi:hypothetical protein
VIDRQGTSLGPSATPAHQAAFGKAGEAIAERQSAGREHHEGPGDEDKGDGQGTEEAENCRSTSRSAGVPVMRAATDKVMPSATSARRQPLLTAWANHSCSSHTGSDL